MINILERHTVQPIDIYEVINNNNILEPNNYQLRDGVWHWNKKNDDVRLHGIYTIDNTNSSHYTMGKGVYKLCFNDGYICDFTIHDDKQIVYWKQDVKGKPIQCTVEHLIRIGRISEADGAYLKFKYDYHVQYYKNQQNS